jgi:hypothetical protein
MRSLSTSVQLTDLERTRLRRMKPSMQHKKPDGILPLGGACTSLDPRVVFDCRLGE